MMFSCTEEVKELLEQWAEEEGRSTSNVIERIVNDAIAAKYGIEITSKPYKRQAQNPPQTPSKKEKQ
ncbi:MAG: ribbon-helix-helix protein, CopG family [Fischerella sp. CENA71]|nr:ribbon-helix-helix protein, CopG family [Fischerella sp. CENA71]